MSELQQMREREKRISAARQLDVLEIERLRAELRETRAYARTCKSTLVDIAQGVPWAQLLAEMALTLVDEA